MDEIEDIEISIASFRSIALSPSSIHGVFWEFGPRSVRGYFADGAYHPVSLWDGVRTIDFTEPIGQQKVFVLPHSEPHTLSRNLGAKRVVVRGTFTPKVMRLMHTLVDYGFFESEPVTVSGQPISRQELITQYLIQVPEANQEPIWGYGLHVCVTGRKAGLRLRRTLWTTHPSAQVPGWSGPDAWAKCVAMPLVAGSLLLARGEYEGTGVDAPEAFLPTKAFLSELEPLGLHVHEKEEEVSGP
jgi:saccharopine dehydrogenase-like NADP-dependent oxidoreductase